MLVEVDKDLGAEYSEYKRNIQWYTEEKRRIKQKSANLLGVYIPGALETDIGKIEYLNSQIKFFKQNKERIKKTRVGHQKVMKQLLRDVGLA